MCTSSLLRRTSCAQGARRDVRSGLPRGGGGGITHLLFTTKPPPDGARVARRAAATLQRDALVLALAQQRVHRAHVPKPRGALPPTVLQGVSLLRQQDRPEHRASDGVCLRPFILFAVFERVIQELPRLGVRVLAVRLGEELDATRQRAIGHPVDEMANVVETVGHPPHVQIRWRGRRWLWRSERWQLRLPDSGGWCEGVQPVEAQLWHMCGVWSGNV
jgi:hypothetical protein